MAGKVQHIITMSSVQLALPETEHTCRGLQGLHSLPEVWGAHCPVSRPGQSPVWPAHSGQMAPPRRSNHSVSGNVSVRVAVSQEQW